ncbi:MAG: hypothetical protein QM662_10030 [Gordonia sp. (in: high G+C Gram-positive bacteria)]
MTARDLDDFRALYERHVSHVTAGDMRAAIADMVRENLATVFDGVAVPRTAVEKAEIVGVYADGETRVGETVYHLTDGVIGLRSMWEQHDDRWLAARLENFPVPSDAISSPGATGDGA